VGSERGLRATSSGISGFGPDASLRGKLREPELSTSAKTGDPSCSQKGRAIQPSVSSVRRRKIQITIESRMRWTSRGRGHHRFTPELGADGQHASDATITSCKSVCVSHLSRDASTTRNRAPNATAQYSRPHPVDLDLDRSLVNQPLRASCQRNFPSCTCSHHRSSSSTSTRLHCPLTKTPQPYARALSRNPASSHIIVTVTTSQRD
jgi:hypothetical protein